MNARILVMSLLAVSAARADGYPVDKLTCGSAFLLEHPLHAGLPDLERPPTAVIPIKFCFFVSEKFARWETTQGGGKTVTSWTLDHSEDKDGASYFRGVSKGYDEDSMKGVAQTLSASNAEHGWFVLATFTNLNARKMWTAAVYWDDLGGYFSDGAGGKAVPVAFAGLPPKAAPRAGPTETARKK